jgi:glycosyltransferase involved in cell wall biosynthesis
LDDFWGWQTRQVIEDFYGVSYPKSSVIYNVIKLPEVRKKPKNLSKFRDKTYFYFYRKIAPQKRICRTNECSQRLLDENLLHSIAVIGGGNEMENLKNQAKELGVEKTLCFWILKKILGLM